jgi:hypothetical protein
MEKHYDTEAVSPCRQITDSFLPRAEEYKLTIIMALMVYVYYQNTCGSTVPEVKPEALLDFPIHTIPEIRACAGSLRSIILPWLS